MPIQIIKCQYAERFDRRGAWNKDNLGTYNVEWDVIVDSGQDYGPIDVINAGRAVITGPTADRVAVWGEKYDFLGKSDNTSFAQAFECFVPDTAQPNNWKIKATFTPPEPGEPLQNIGVNPLNKAPEYAIEWIEEMVPLEEARCFSSLPGIKRGYQTVPPAEGPYNSTHTPFTEDQDPLYPPSLPSFPGYPKPGPIVNAAGNQTIDPVTIPVYHPVLVVFKNYPDPLQAAVFNATYQLTVNGDNFVKDPARTWRYVITTTDRLQQQMVPGVDQQVYPDGIISFYPTTVKFEFRLETWDKLIVNNGMVCFSKKQKNQTLPYVKYQGGPLNGKIVEFPTLVRILKAAKRKNAIDTGFIKDDEANEADNDVEWVDSAEPMNLNYDGTQNEDPEGEATFIDYRHLIGADYYETNLFGDPNDINNPFGK